MESEITLSPEVARDAARFFFWHRNLTRFGLLFLGSLAVLIAFAAVIYPYQNLRFVLGAVCALVVVNVLMQVHAVLTAPRRLARTISGLKSTRGRVTTDEDGFTLTVGGNVATLRWSQIRYLWPRDRFIALGFSYFRMVHLPTEGMPPDVRAEFEKRASRNIGA